MTRAPRIGTLIGTGNVADVYAYGDDVLKLFKPGIGRSTAEREAAALDWLGRTSLPVPRGLGIVEHEGRWGLWMTRAEGRPFAEAMMGQGGVDPVWLAALAKLHRDVNAIPGHGLPSLTDKLAARIAGLSVIGSHDTAVLLERLKAMPAGERLCHGDFHPFNVLGTPQHPTIIDWLDATCGLPAADLCRSYVLLRPRFPVFAEAYLDACLAEGTLGRDEVLAWLPIVAAARLAETIPDEDRAVLLACARG